MWDVTSQQSRSSDLWSVTNDHVSSACGLECGFQLSTGTEPVIWGESLFTVHPIPHDTAGIPVHQIILSALAYIQQDC